MNNNSKIQAMRKLYPDITDKDMEKCQDIEPPAEGECCNTGCYPCVWDHYFMAIRKRCGK